MVSEHRVLFFSADFAQLMRMYPDFKNMNVWIETNANLKTSFIKIIPESSRVIIQVFIKHVHISILNGLSSYFHGNYFLTYW